MTDVRSDRVVVQVLLANEYDPAPPVAVRADRLLAQALLTGPLFLPVAVRADRVLVQVLLANPPTLPPVFADNFADAQDFGSPVGASQFFLPWRATLEPGEPVPAGVLGTVWARWTAPVGGGALHVQNFDVEPLPGTTPVAVITTVYTGSSVGALTPVPTTPEDPGWFVFDVTGGTTYYFQMGGGTDFVDTENGAFWITLVFDAAEPVGPANDNFADAQVVAGTSGTVTGTNVNATLEVGEPAAYRGGGAHTIWYQWTAPSAAEMAFDTIGTGFDTVLDVFTGSSVGALTRIAGDDDSGGSLTSKITFTPVSGTTYHFRVNGYGTSTTGVVRFNWAPTPPPPPPTPEPGFMIGVIAMTSLVG